MFHFGQITFELLVSSFSEAVKKAMDRGNCFKEVSAKKSQEMSGHWQKWWSQQKTWVFIV